MIEAAGMSERYVYIYKTTPCCIPEDNSKFSYIFLQTLLLIYVNIYIFIYLLYVQGVSGERVEEFK